MPIEFSCPNCARPYKVGEANAGKRFACKQCGNAIQVPDEGVQSTAPATSPAAAAPVAAAGARRPPGAGRPGVAQRPQSAIRPYGAQAGARKLGRKLNFIFLGGALAMILGFFLPWISIDAGILKISMGGYELPAQFNKMISFADKFLEAFDDPELQNDPEMKKVRDQISDLKTRGLFLYAIYLIPILTLAASIEEFLAARKGRNLWWLRSIAAASPIIAYIVVWVAFSGLDQSGTESAPTPSPAGSEFDLMKVIGIGVWISMIGFVASVVGIFVAPKAPKEGEPGASAPGPRRPPAAPPQRTGTSGQRPALTGGPRRPGAKAPLPRPRRPQ